jgi:hypothetical protein
MNWQATRATLAGFGTAVLISTTAYAHHSPVEYDRETITEFEGEVLSVFWGNPHVIVEVATNESGAESVWELEGAAVSSQRRRGVPEGLIQVGDTIRVAGHASTRRENALLTEHLLLPNGTEILLGSTREPRWSDTEIGSSAWMVDPDRASTAEGDGIFRVWSRGPGVWPWYFDEAGTLGLTESARAVAEAFDPFEDNPLLDCTKPGMPALMGNPYPMQFIDQGATIEVRFEEFDVVRTIHMNSDGASAVQPSPLGHSVGQWQGDTLEVHTSRINWPHFGRVGIPQTEAVEVVERFILDDGGERLDYELTIEDPGTLLAPYSWDGFWVWRPGEEVGRYECTVE